LFGFQNGDAKEAALTDQVFRPGVVLEGNQNGGWVQGDRIEAVRSQAMALTFMAACDNRHACDPGAHGFS